MTLLGRGRSFLAWGAAAYGLVVAVLLARSLEATEGVLVYALDDPAIHLSIADNLVHHGTWGVVPGEFQSASSSPLWTLLVAAYQVVSPLPDSTGPLVLNAIAAVALVLVLARTQRLLVPGWRRPLDAVALALLVTFPLFLPALTLVGMEHILHMALAVLAVALFQRRESRRWPGWLPFAVVAVATTVRFETAFVAAGIGAALLVDRARLRTVALVGAAAALPLAAVSVWTRASGQGWLPNSVLAKLGADTKADDDGPITAAFDRLTADPLVAVLALVAVGVLASRADRWRRHRFAAVVLLVATFLHVALARVGWYDRYQAYLLALGIAMVLGVAGDALAGAGVRTHRAAAAIVIGASLVLCGLKVHLTRDVPTAVEDTYAQRFLAGEFLARYYDGQAIATGELGYISLAHDGPITDLLGLGDREVLEERLATGDQPSAGYWARLAEERGFRVVAMYPTTTFLDTPDSWILVGTWRLGREVVSAFHPEFQFWATTPEEVDPLIDHLTEFEAELPDVTTLQMNELARYRADLLREAQEG